MLYLENDYRQSLSVSMIKERSVRLGCELNFVIITHVQAVSSTNSLPAITAENPIRYHTMYVYRLPVLVARKKKEICR